MAEQFTFPQSGDNDDAEHFGSLIGQANLSDYVETGLNLQNYNAAGPDIDITTGKCFISQISETASSSGDTILSTNSVIQVPATSTLSLTDAAVNEIYVDPDFGTDDNASVAATTSGVPSNGLKIGEVDTSADTVNQNFNREPSIVIESITDADGNSIYIDGSSGAVEDSKQYDNLSPSDGSFGDFLATDGTTVEWRSGADGVASIRETSEFDEVGVTLDGLTDTGNAVEEGGLDDISTASYDNKTLDVSGETTVPDSNHISNGGVDFYMAEGDIHEYTLSTPYDVSTGSLTTTHTISEANATDLQISDNGNKLFILGVSNDNIYEYDLGTAYDIGSRSFVQSYSVGAEDDGPEGFTISHDGEEIYYTGSGSGGNNVFKYVLKEPFDLTSVQNDGSFDASSQIDSSIQGLHANYDASRIYVVEQDGDVHEYTLSTPGDMSTASFNQTFNDTGNTSNPTGFGISKDGKKLYFSDNNTDAIQQYSISTVEAGTIEFEEPSVLKDWVSANYIASDSGITVNVTDGDGSVLISDISENENISQITDTTIAYEIDFSSAPIGANVSWFGDAYIGSGLSQQFSEWRSGWDNGTNNNDHAIMVQGQARDNGSFQTRGRVSVDGVIVDSTWRDGGDTAHVSAVVPPGSTWNFSFITGGATTGQSYRIRDIRN